MKKKPSIQQIQDIALAGMIEVNSEEGIMILYDRYARFSYKLLRTNLFDPNLADEIIGDVFSKVIRDITKFDPYKQSLCEWLLEITRKMMQQTNQTNTNRKQRLQQIPDFVLNIQNQNPIIQKFFNNLERPSLLPHILNRAKK